MLVCFWSPKGGSGTSVVTAAAGVLLARAAPARIADLIGDQPAVLALGREPELGVRDWMRAGPETPSDALERVEVGVARDLTLLPAGSAALDDLAPEAGAALAVALGDDPRPTVCDAGRLDHPVLGALAEVADASVVVVRACYLALRRAVRHPSIELALGAVLVDEHGRALGARDVEDVLGVPVLATIEARGTVARAVDAGVLTSRIPDSVARPLRHALRELGLLPGARAA